MTLSRNLPQSADCIAIRNESAQADRRPHNPVTGARRAYPFVVLLQSDVAQIGRDRAVAPVAPRAAFPPIPGRLAPIVTIKRGLVSVETMGAEKLRKQIGDFEIVQIGERYVRVAGKAVLAEQQHLGVAAVLVDDFREEPGLLHS